VSPPNDPNWGFLKVPGAWSAAGFTPFWHRDDPLAGKGGALGQAWYEREVTVPLEWQGRRIGIHAEKVATDAHVYCDGHFAGTIGYAGGGVDITPWAKPGVKVRVSALVLTRRPAEILAEFGVPASGDTGPETRGLVGDVYLTSEPPRGPHVGPFQIMTTVKNQEIRVRTNLEITDSDVTGLAVVCQVKDGPRTVKTFSAPLPNGAAIAEPSTAWPDAELWDIGHPKLYTLTV
jgi:beta-galactosidase/beta-glucuronidase